MNFLFLQQFAGRHGARCVLSELRGLLIAEQCLFVLPGGVVRVHALGHQLGVVLLAGLLHLRLEELHLAVKIRHLGVADRLVDVLIADLQGKMGELQGRLAQAEGAAKTPETKKSAGKIGDLFRGIFDANSMEEVRERLGVIELCVNKLEATVKSEVARLDGRIDEVKVIADRAEDKANTAQKTANRRTDECLRVVM